MLKAGTGKSTLVKFIIEALNVNSEDVCYAAFTGKAAEVLRKKGNPNACTLHKLLYDHYPRPDGTFYRKIKKSIPYKIIVIDEVSMVPKEMVELLLSYKNYIIFLGDPFQIPPIDKDTDNHLLDNPHIFLDQIMRQAEDSEIIRLSLDIREGRPIQNFTGSNVMVVGKKDFVPEMLTWADEILVATNANRVKINNQVRQLNGRGPFPEDGDKVVCLRNYWDDISAGGDSLVNGTIGFLSNPIEKNISVPYWCKTQKKNFPIIQSNIITDTNEIFSTINCDKNLITNGSSTLDWKDSYRLSQLKQRLGDIVPKELTYGYAITCHKAQGSEWDKVLVLEESFPFDKTEHARWLYTACTRAASRLVLVR